MQRGCILFLLTEGPDTGAGLDLQMLDIGPPALPHPDNLPFMVQGHAETCLKPWEVRAAAGAAPSHTLKETAFFRHG